MRALFLADNRIYQTHQPERGAEGNRYTKRMANHFFRSRLINNVTRALAEADGVAALKHPGLVGRYRELLMADIIRPFLPMGFGLGSGKIVDSTGAQSTETDVVVFDQSMIPH